MSNNRRDSGTSRSDPRNARVKDDYYSSDYYYYVGDGEDSGGGYVCRRSTGMVVWRRSMLWKIPYCTQKLLIGEYETIVPRGLCQLQRELLEVVIPKWVKKIEKQAFSECPFLKNVCLTEGLIEIGNDVFRGCHSIRKIKIPSTVERIGRFAFADCRKMDSIKLSNRLERLEEGTFYRCLSLIAISIPSSVAIIEMDTFHECKNLRMVYPEETSLMLEEIGENAFEGTDLHQFTIPSTMRTIGRYAFASCMSLRDLQVEEGVETIGTAAFEECTSLHAVSLPRSLKRIGNRAFDGSNKLVSIEIGNQTNVWLAEEAFQGCSNLVNVFVPLQSMPYNNSTIHFTCFDDCDSLGRGTTPLETVSTRFDEYPIHRLCYYASTTTVNDLRRAVEMTKRNKEDHLDNFGMTPFHILLSSSTPRMDLLQILLDAYPRYMLNWKDRHGKLSVQYMKCTSSGQWSLVLQTLLDAWFLTPLVTWGLARFQSQMTSKVSAIMNSYQQSHRVVGLLVFAAQNTFKTFEKYENMRLLEMAVWNMKLMSAAGVSVDANVDNSKRREACRIRCGASIIVPRVLAFYGSGQSSAHDTRTVRSDTVPSM